MDNTLQHYKRDLALKGYAETTQNNYFGIVKRFQLRINKDLRKINAEDIKDHLHYLIEVKKRSRGLIAQTYSAFKYLFIQTLKRKWPLDDIPKTKQDTKTLPTFLSFEEISKLLDSVTNLKHKTMFIVAYSSGLRVSEVVKLKPTDIDRKNMRLFIRKGKGKKDRYTILSKIALKVLEQYYRAYRPGEWLFFGYDKKKPMSTRSLQHTFYAAKERAGITKKCGIHVLRHSFATHMLETGGGIFQLQQFLGHKKIKTTLRYAHVQQEKIIANSPFDVYGKLEQYIS